MWRALAIALAVTSAPLSAETLADIRQDIEVLKVELLRLNRELNTTGGATAGVDGSVLDRITTIEAELQRVTAKTEELEFRIGQVVKDGTNRVGDLSFRLCELEPACDIGSFEAPGLLGGGASDEAQPPQAAPAPPQDAALPVGGAQLAISEEADFREALAALEAGDFGAAAQMFAGFRDIYPMGPLEAAALIGEGRALEGAGDMREAARRYLSAYSDFPKAEVAPEALWRLGTSLAALGSKTEACVTLGEVPNRYAGSEYAAQAQASRSALDCP